MTMDRAMIEQVYATMRTKQAAARRLMGRPLTLTEKILFAHVAEMPSAPPVRRKGYVDFRSRPGGDAGRYCADGDLAVHAGRSRRHGSAQHDPCRPPRFAPNSASSAICRSQSRKTRKSMISC